MHKGVRIADLFRQEPQYLGKAVQVQGWVRTRRDSKAGVTFIELNDGSCLRNLQVVAETSRGELQPELDSVTTGSSLRVEGTVQASPGREQTIELQAGRIELYGRADPARYPLQKKRHSFEFLRQVAHLRPRTNTIGAVTRVRNKLSQAIHHFFQERGFYWIHTPVITSGDCEGAGEVFRVTTLDLQKVASEFRDGVNPFEGDFFGKPVYLTVSGQLQAEIYALSLGKVYTFGPAFRAENSNTSRHLAEFWMVEPEMAFYDLEDDLDLARSFLEYLAGTVLADCLEDLHFFSRFVEPGVIETLKKLALGSFEVITYGEAVEALQKSGEKFTFPVSWGKDLQAEHERYLAEKYVGGPLAVVDFPRDLKPFYMRVNDDEKTVAAMDILVPRVGEIIGGSQREERLDVLLEQMTRKGISPEDYRWYLDLREYGSAPHAGFGLGLERMVQFVTGLGNIREAIPFPRTPGNAEF
ncbi:MAG: asparagine--tRNA ligase [Syntrophobacteraceae bacterium]|nr:asparagine--tRNA ligase [Syntrophobacteraceae bacterium]